MKKGVSILFLIGYIHCTFAQAHRTPVAAWLLPGLSWKVSEKVSLMGELGYNKYFNAGLGYMQGFITVHKNIVLNPAYIYYANKDPGQPFRHEHFLMPAIIGQIALGNFLLDDRNMFWDRISANTGPRYYYRNRLRLAQSFRVKQAQARIYGYEEAFYFFNDGRWMRNRIAMGASYDLLRQFNLDITYIYQWDQGSGWLHLFFIMGTVKF